jgi:hypothetical protein
MAVLEATEARAELAAAAAAWEETAYLMSWLQETIWI